MNFRSFAHLLLIAMHSGYCEWDFHLIAEFFNFGLYFTFLLHLTAVEIIIVVLIVADALTRCTALTNAVRSKIVLLLLINAVFYGQDVHQLTVNLAPGFRSASL